MPKEDPRFWVDVAILHEPRKKRAGRKEAGQGGFGHNVGLDGYERGTGEEVVREPSFKRPSDRKPRDSRPFSE